MGNKSSIVNNTIGIKAKWPLFDGGKAKSLYLYNKKKAKEAEVNFQIQLAKIRNEVEESYIKLETSHKNILSSTV